MARIRCGTHELNIEQGRHLPTRNEITSRLCKMCSMGAVEDEKHTLCDCPLYHQERQQVCAAIQANWSIDRTNSSHSMTLQFVMLTLCYANGNALTVIYPKQSLPVDLALRFHYFVLSECS